jgi:hypothetical protein
LPPKAVLSELAARSEFQPAEVSPVLVRRSRCAVGRSLSSAVFPRRARRPQLSDRTIPLFEFRSPPEYYPADPSQPNLAQPAPLMGFCSLQHMLGSEVYLPRACLTRYVPPSGFDYPLGGLLPPSPRRFCFAPTALLGFTLRSFPLPQGIRCVSARKDPRTVSPAVATVAETTGRPGRPRFLGFDPCRSPWRLDAGLAHQPLAAPLGFALLGLANSSLGRTLTRPPLTRFVTCPRACRRRPRVSIGSCLAQLARRGKPQRLTWTALVGS